MATIETVPAQYTIILNQVEFNDLKALVFKAAAKQGNYSTEMTLAESLYGDDEHFWGTIEGYRSYQR